jgi:hypothetical protein
MGVAFQPYVQPLLPIISQHMTYAHSKQIRKFALRTFRNMLIAIGEPQNIQLFQEAFPMFVTQINTALSKMDKKNAKLYI